MQRLFLAAFAAVLSFLPQAASARAVEPAALLADLVPGPAGSVPSTFTSVGVVAFFRTVDVYQNPVELWRSDGTPAGTFGLGVCPAGAQYSLAWTEEHLYFLGFDGGCVIGEPAALFRTDGSREGTVKLTQGLAFPQPTDGWPAVGYVPALQRLFFRADDGAHGTELWATDGSAGGAVPLGDLRPGPPGSTPRLFQEHGGELYFWAELEPQAFWLYRSDGTPGGTVAVKGPFSAPRQAVTLGGALYFLAYSGHEAGLWRSDGTPTGTTLVAAFPDGSLLFAPTAANGRLYFSLETPDRGQELWVSDGTAAGTRRLTDFANPEVFASGPRVTGLGSHTVFIADQGSDLGQVWGTDGTPAGTQRLVPCDGCGTMASVADTGAIVDAAAATGALTLDGTTEELAAGGSCVADEQTLCLQDGRFRVRATWTDFSGNQGIGKAVRLTADTGYFWFFGADNVEVVLKVLDGRPVNDHFWVFYGALSSVEYVLTVTDTVTGVSRTYRNPSGELASRADTRALPAE